MKLIPNINNEHAQDYSRPRATLACCSQGGKVTSARQVLCCSRCRTVDRGTNLGIIIALGKALPMVHMIICSPRATFPRVNFI